MAVKARPENSRRRKGPSVTAMSISLWPSIRPRSPFPACPPRLPPPARAKGVLEAHARNSDHQQAPRQLGGQKLPAQEDKEHEAKLEDQVGGREFEDDRVREMGALAKERAGYRHRRI